MHCLSETIFKPVCRWKACKSHVEELWIKANRRGSCGRLSLTVYSLVERVQLLGVLEGLLSWILKVMIKRKHSCASIGSRMWPSICIDLLSFYSISISHWIWFAIFCSLEQFNDVLLQENVCMDTSSPFFDLDALESIENERNVSLEALKVQLLWVDFQESNSFQIQICKG